MSGPTTLADVQVLAPLVEAVKRNDSVTIAINGDTSQLLTGTLRHFTAIIGDGNHLRGDENLWHAYVRVSATNEHWFSVQALVDGIHNGTVALNYKP